jgi:hypothetical protein
MQSAHRGRLLVLPEQIRALKVNSVHQVHQMTRTTMRPMTSNKKTEAT